MLGAALVTLIALRRGIALTVARVAGAGVLVVGAALVIVVVDSVTGGDGHVVDAVRDGPGDLADTVWQRLRLSWHGLNDSADAIAVSVLGGLVLVATAIMGRRGVCVRALVVGLAVSLAVNDTAVDILLYGMLGALSLLAWERLDVPDRRRHRSSRPSPAMITLMPGQARRR